MKYILILVVLIPSFFPHQVQTPNALDSNQFWMCLIIVNVLIFSRSKLGIFKQIITNIAA